MNLKDSLQDQLRFVSKECHTYNEGIIMLLEKEKKIILTLTLMRSRATAQNVCAHANLYAAV